MSARPPSLGDANPSKYVRIREKAEMPTGRENLAREIRRILDIGFVQKLIVEVGQPLVFERLVLDDAGVYEDLAKVDADEFYGLVRNSEIVDFRHRGDSSFETLFHAFQFLAQRGLAAKTFLVQNWLGVRDWLGADAEAKPIIIYGVQALLHEQVPEDVIILVATSLEEPDVVKLSLRITLDMEKPQRRTRK